MTRILPSLLGAVACLHSCAPTALPTRSGRPEVVVRPPAARAKAVAIDTMIATGHVLTNQSENILTFERDMPPAQSMLYLAAVGNSYYSQPKGIVRLTFVPAANGVKIYANAQVATQGPFGQMKTVDMSTGKAGQDIQALLESIKRRVGQ
jgi:hypothetical protein